MMMYGKCAYVAPRGLARSKLISVSRFAVAVAPLPTTRAGVKSRRLRRWRRRRRRTPERTLSAAIEGGGCGGMKTRHNVLSFGFRAQGGGGGWWPSDGCNVSAVRPELARFVLLLSGSAGSSYRNIRLSVRVRNSRKMVHGNGATAAGRYCCWVGYRATRFTSRQD
jgi:hypothetical protein